VLLASGLVQGITGFGFGLFALGVLGVIMPMDRAVVIVSVAGLASFLVNLWTVRRDVPWRETWPLLIASIPALLLGVHCLQRVDDRLLRAGLGVTILGGCLVMLWSPKRARIHRASPWGYVAGLVGGFVGGAVGASGPPVVLYVLLRGWGKSAAKGLLSAYFTLIGVWRIVALAMAGVGTTEAYRQGLLMVVPAVLASHLGALIFGRMSTRTFRYAALALLAGLSAKLLIAA